MLLCPFFFLSSCLSSAVKRIAGAVWVYRSGRKLLFDFVVHLRTRQTGGDANSVFDGVGVGAAVGNHANSAHAQQRRAAIFGVIDGFLQAL